MINFRQPTYGAQTQTVDGRPMSVPPQSYISGQVGSASLPPALNVARLQADRLAQLARVRKPPMPEQAATPTQQMIAQGQQRRAMLNQIMMAEALKRQKTQQPSSGIFGSQMFTDPMSPAGQALGAAAATGLQLSGYTDRPRTFGQNLGEILAAGQEAYSAAQGEERDRRMEEALFGLKVAEATRPDLTTLQQNLMAAGYDLSSPEGQAAMRHQLEKSDADTIFLGGDKQKEMAYGSAIKTRENMAKQVNQDRELGTRLQTVVDLLESGVETGRVQSAMLPLKQLGREMGFLSDAQVADLTDQEIIDSAAAFLTPRMRVVGSGASSDRDMDFFARATVRLANTPEANLVIAKMQKQVMDYNRDRLSLFDEYVQREGNDFGFGDYADKQMGEIYSRVTSNKQFSDLIESGKIKEGDVFYNAITDEFDVLTKEMM
jgi:hypothetical protein